MKPLSPNATAIMQELLSGMSHVGASKKINNSPSFMPLCVECIGTSKEGKLFSLAHYGLLNGDTMRDPEIVFLEQITPDGFYYYPVNYRNDYAGYFSEGIIFEDNKTMVYPKEYADMLSFSEMWMENIRQQQSLTVLMHV